MCGKLARQFNISDETVRLHLHRLGKAYKLSKWVPHMLSEVHKRQQVAPAYRCFITTVPHPYSIECLPVMKSGFCTKPPSIPDIVCHPTPQDCLCTHTRLWFVPGGQVIKWFIVSYYQWPNGHWRSILAAIGTCSTGTAPEGASTGELQRCAFPPYQCQATCCTSGPGYHTATWGGRLCAIQLPPLPLPG